MARWREPMRAVENAVTGCQIAGILVLLPGVLSAAEELHTAVLGWRVPAVFVGLVATLVTVGAGYLVSAYHLARHRPAAAVCGVILTGAALLVLVGLVAVTLWSAMAIAADVDGAVPIGAAVCLCAAVPGTGLAWLLVQLRRSLAVLRRATANQRRGFAVLPVQTGGEP